MFGFIARLVIKAQRSKPTTGDIGLAGEIGMVQSDIDGTGKVFVHGEFWDAKSQYKIAKGERVRVTSVHGLLLEVEPVSKD
jgi:membrane-bound serine protease (ClpP class)